VGQFEAGLNLGGPGAPPDLDLAIQELRRAIAQKEDAEAHNVLGRMLGLAGADAKLVTAEFEAAIRIRPDYSEARNNLGLVYTQTGEDEKAITAFGEAIRQRPDYAEAHANLGAILTATDVAKAVRELEKAIELQPGLLKAHYNLAMAYGSSPEHGTDREIEQLGKLLSLQPDYPRAEFALGKALLRKGSVEEAIARLERAAKMEPEFGEAHYQLGLALARAGRQKDAAAELQRGRDLIAAGQREQTLRLEMDEGKAALDKGDVDLALVKFRQAARLRPDLAEAHYQLGLALARKGELDSARDAFRMALKVNPGHDGAKRDLDRLPGGRAVSDDPHQVETFEAHVREGKFKELEPLLQEYLKTRPDSWWGWYALGYTFFAQRKIGDSINALAKSLSLNVANAEAHKVLGRNLMTIGRFDAAQLEFEQGAKYNPQSAEMPYNLGKLFSIQDQWPEAKTAFERAVRLDPSYMEAYDGLGFALEALGEDAAALAHYEKAAGINEARKGNFGTPYVNLSAYHNRAGNSDAAFEFARKAIEVNPKSDRAWFQMAKGYERRGALEPAADALQRAISINSRASSYYYVLATVYRRLGKSKESREAMETFSRLELETNQLEEKRRESLRQEGLVRE